ncbi:hypothetical protein BVRB_1g010400 [Beta vulgaris subsp. vulgaris]|nr:hypothetical protein BVRB_1g010400 [Beta vulgaris subsp. vulgaris]
MAKNKMEKKSKSSEEVAFYLKPKKGSVIPAKRKLVKRMIWDQILSIFLFPISSNHGDSFIQNNKKSINHQVYPEKEN